VLHFETEPRRGYLYVSVSGELDVARIAIYAVAPLMDPHRYTQTVATNRGALVRSSDSLPELLSWLGV
jgi:hypothetical protein